MEGIPFRLHFREFCRIVGEELLPVRFGSAGFLAQFFIVRIDFIRDVERFLRLRPAEVFFHSDDIFFTERRTVSGSRTLLSRAAVANLGLDGDERRMFFVGFCFFNGFADGFKIRAVFDSDRLEAEGSHAALDIFRKGDIRAAFDGNAVAVIEDDEFIEAERTC